MAIPMLSQDEFFHHLQLQSVHQVKQTFYRQALKERLRASTKQGQGATPTKKASAPASPPVAPPTSAEKPAAWLAPPPPRPSCRRRLLAPVKCRDDKKPAEAAPTPPPEASDQRVLPPILEPLMRNCPQELLPRLQSDLTRALGLSRNCKNAPTSTSASSPPSKSSSRSSKRLRLQQQASEGGGGENVSKKSKNPSSSSTSSSSSSSHILTRVNYLKPPASASRQYNDDEKTYISCVRLQPGRDQRPRDRPVTSSTLAGFPPSPERPAASANSATSATITASSSATVDAGCFLVPAVPPPSTSSSSSPAKPMRCRLCSKRFLSRRAYVSHQETAHDACTVCKSKFATAWKRRVATTYCAGACEKCKKYADKVALGDYSGRSKLKKHALGLVNNHHHHHHHHKQNNNSLVSVLVKCDICSKLFSRQYQMIKHVLNNHPSQVHKVDLLKFAGNKGGVAKSKASKLIGGDGIKFKSGRGLVRA